MIESAISTGIITESTLHVELAGLLGQGIRLRNWQKNWEFDEGFFPPQHRFVFQKTVGLPEHAFPPLPFSSPRPNQQPVQVVAFIPPSSNHRLLKPFATPPSSNHQLLKPSSNHRFRSQVLRVPDTVDRRVLSYHLLASVLSYISNIRCSISTIIYLLNIMQKE